MVDVRGLVRQGVLRLRADGPGAGAGRIGAGDLRVLLVADVVFRVVEARGARVLSAYVAPGAVTGGTAALEEWIRRLAVHPPALCADDGAARAALGGAPDLCLGGPGGNTGGDTGGARIAIGRVDEAGDSLGADPLAVRLALLGRPHEEPVTLDDAALDDAARTLERWRAAVAAWAEYPSYPVPARFADAARGVLFELDTPALLGLLHEAEDDAAIAPGSKFETFAWADRVLALDLPRLIGSA